MSITLGLNISSLKSQRELARSSDQLASVFERLSSGQRINKASDDAAGLAIADSLRSDARVYTQGVRNLNDGVSLFNIADAAIEGLTSIVVRLQELAEQSANGVYGDTQRAALDAEAQALRQEYFRISKSVEFNGKNLLNGDTTGVSLQAGMGTNAVLQFGVGGAIGDGTFEGAANVGSATSFLSRTADFNGDGNADLISYDFGTGIVLYTGTGNGTFNTGSVVYSGVPTLDLEVHDANGDGNLDLIFSAAANEVITLLGDGGGTFSSAVTSSSSLTSVDKMELADFNGDGIMDLVAIDQATAFEIAYGNGDGTFTTIQTQATGIIDELHAADYDNDGDIDLVGIRIGGNQVFIEGLSNGTVDYGTVVSFGTATANAGSLSVDLNGDGIEDVVAASHGANALKVFISDSDGTFTQTNYSATLDNLSFIEFGDFNGDGFKDIVSTSATGNQIQLFLGDGNGSLSLSDTQSSLSSLTYGLSVNDFNNDGVLDALTGGDLFSLFAGSTTDGVAPLLDFDLSTMSGARQALPQFQNKLQQLSSQRSEIGAHLSRIQAASNNLSSAAENYKAAESRIRDADIALESSNLVRLNILQQAASAVLAQANLQPQLVLRLLE